MYKKVAPETLEITLNFFLYNTDIDGQQKLSEIIHNDDRENLTFTHHSEGCHPGCHDGDGFSLQCLMVHGSITEFALKSDFSAPQSAYLL